MDDRHRETDILKGYLVFTSKLLNLRRKFKTNIKNKMKLDGFTRPSPSIEYSIVKILHNYLCVHFEQIN